MNSGESKSQQVCLLFKTKPNIENALIANTVNCLHAKRYNITTKHNYLRKTVLLLDSTIRLLVQYSLTTK